MPFGQGAAAPASQTSTRGTTIPVTFRSQALTAELEQAGAAVLAAFEATPASVPFMQRLMSRKLIATVVFELGTLITTIAGGLPHNEAGIVAGVGAAVYVLAQGIVDSAAVLHTPPPGFAAVPTAHLLTLLGQQQGVPGEPLDGATSTAAPGGGAP